MRKMTNGITTCEIPSGAAKLYEGLGFTDVECVEQQVEDIDEENYSDEYTEDGTDSEVDGTSNDEADSNEEFVNSVLEKPLSQWSKAEIKQFAEIKGLDISGTKNANEARAIIKEYLDEEQRNS